MTPEYIPIITRITVIYFNTVTATMIITTFISAAESIALPQLMLLLIIMIITIIHYKSVFPHLVCAEITTTGLHPS